MILQRVLLGDWLTWWNGEGRRQLSDLLDESWDPFEDATFRIEAAERIDVLGRQLHEGADIVDVQSFLHDLRHTRWPDRWGRKWTSRDRAVAKRVVEWYRTATGEHGTEAR